MSHKKKKEQYWHNFRSSMRSIWNRKRKKNRSFEKKKFHSFCVEECPNGRECARLRKYFSLHRIISNQLCNESEWKKKRIQNKNARPQKLTVYYICVCCNSQFSSLIPISHGIISFSPLWILIKCRRMRETQTTHSLSLMETHDYYLVEKSRKNHRHFFFLLPSSVKRCKFYYKSFRGRWSQRINLRWCR